MTSRETDEGQAATGAANLGAWLTKWDLKSHEQKLRAHGIKSASDFQYIKSKQHFNALVEKLGDVISFMDVLKLEDAWSSIVTKPQQTQSEAQQQLLGEKERQIMIELWQRYDNVTADITILTNALQTFNESVVVVKKQVNENTNRIISTVNKKRAQLLCTIDTLTIQNRRRFNVQLNRITAIQQQCAQHKQKFNTIESSTSLSSSQKLVEFQKLLRMNQVNGTENKNNNKNQNSNAGNDNHDDNDMKVGDGLPLPLTIPGSLNTQFAEQAINEAVQTHMTIHCDEVAPEWQQESQVLVSSSLSRKAAAFVFDVFESQYMSVTQNGRLVTGILHCSYSVVSTKTAFSTGVHRWRIKFLKLGHHHSNPGVITDSSILYRVERGYTQLKGSKGSACCGYLYMLHDFDTQLQAFDHGVLFAHKDIDRQIQVNDIITVVLDCERWTITFIRHSTADANEEGVVVGAMQITPHLSYHPCLYTCACTTQQYQLL